MDDQVGFDKKPDRYSGDYEGTLETIDRMRLMLRNWVGASGLDLEALKHPDDFDSLDTNLIGDLMFLGFCMATEFKYDDRAGKKLANPEEIDLQKAAWYRQMGDHVEGKGQDPRVAREGWAPRVKFDAIWPPAVEEDLDEVDGEVRGWSEDGAAWILRCPHCGDIWLLAEAIVNHKEMHPCDIIGTICITAQQPSKDPNA